MAYLSSQEHAQKVPICPEQEVSEEVPLPFASLIELEKRRPLLSISWRLCQLKRSECVRFSLQTELQKVTASAWADVSSPAVLPLL